MITRTVMSFLNRKSFYLLFLTSIHSFNILNWKFLIDRIRILGIELELACTRGLCGEIFSRANSF